MGKYCSKCGYKLDEDLGVCPNCGAKQIIKLSNRKPNESNVEVKDRLQVSEKVIGEEEQKSKKKKHRGIKILFITLFACIFTAVLGILLIKFGMFGMWTQRSNDDVISLDDDIYYKPLDENLVNRLPDSELGYVKDELVLITGKEVSKNDIENEVGKYGGKVVGLLENSNTYQIEFEEDISFDKLTEIKNELQNRGNVEFADYNLVFALNDYTGYYPNDEQWKNKWITQGGEWDDGYRIAIGGSNWGMEVIEAPYAWEYLKHQNTSSVKIGIFEPTGFNLDHEDLQGKFKDFRNIYTSMGEDADHGTAVAGIIGADFDNNIGMCGVVPNVDLVGVTYDVIKQQVEKEKNNENKGNKLTMMTCCAAIEYLIANCGKTNTAVINMSLGWDGIIHAATNGNKEAISDEKWINKGIADHLKKLLNKGYEFLIVKAAGNSNETEDDNRRYEFLRTDEGEKKAEYGYVLLNELEKEDLWKLKKKYEKDFNERIEYGNVDAQYDIFAGIEEPEIKDRIIVVGSTSPYKDKVSGFSCEGERVDILASGDGIGVLTADGYTDDGGWGTSYSAPFVTGVAGLALSIKPHMSGSELKQLLMNSSVGEYAGTLNGIEYKHKMVNAFETVKNVNNINDINNMESNVDESDILESYKQIVQTEEENLYRCRDLENPINGTDFLYRDLIDFNGDGTDELLIAFVSQVDEFGDANEVTYGIYQYNVLTMTAEEVYSGKGALFTNGGYAYISIFEKEGKKYYTPHEYIEDGALESIIGFENGKCKVLKSFQYPENNPYSNNYKVDGVKVSEEEWNKKREEWYQGSTKEQFIDYLLYPVNSNEDDESAKTMEHMKEINKKLGIDDFIHIENS